MSNNGANTTLNGQTGTGSIVGSDSPVMTGAVDCGSATTIVIPSGASPALSNTGDVSLDTGITDYNTQLSYNDGSAAAAIAGVAIADVSLVDRNVVNYDAVGNKLVISPSGTSSGGSIVQYVIATSVVDDSTSSTAPVDTSLSIGITPMDSLNVIIVSAYGYGINQYIGGGTSSTRTGTFLIYRSTGVAAILSSFEFGRQFAPASNPANPSYVPVALTSQEVSGGTALHTYVLRFESGDLDAETSLLGATSQAFMIAMEVTPY